MWKLILGSSKKSLAFWAGVSAEPFGEASET